MNFGGMKEAAESEIAAFSSKKLAHFFPIFGTALFFFRCAYSNSTWKVKMIYGMLFKENLWCMWYGSYDLNEKMIYYKICSNFNLLKFL